MKTPARGPRLLIRIAAWTLAVPALCAAVLVGGAAPLYLLLPDAKPAAETTLPAVPQIAPASQSSRPAGQPEQAGAPPPTEVMDDMSTETTVTEDVPAEGDENPPIEIAAATMVPTPRPGTPMPYRRPLPSEETRTVAALPAAPDDATPPAKARPAATDTKSPLAGQRKVVRTAVKLRAAPQGAEIGVLREGDEIVVGRCDTWCEVTADGRRGFVYASLINGANQSSGANRSSGREIGRRDDVHRVPRRIDDGRQMDARRGPYDGPRYNRRDDRYRDEERRDDERRFYERAYRRGVDPDWLQDDRDYRPEEPDWYVEDAPPPGRAGPPVLLYYEPYP